MWSKMPNVGAGTRGSFQVATGGTRIAGTRAEPQAPPPAERQGWSWKAILLLALAVYAILLIIQNRKTVSVDFVVFTEKTRVVWLVLLSIGLGALIMWLLPRLRRRGRKSRKDPEKEPEASPESAGR